LRASLILLVLLPSAALAADVVCQKPGGRDVSAISQAIQQDEAMAAAFDATAAACVHGTTECDDQRVKCGNLLTETLREQVRFDEGAYLRDMLVLFSGQHYTMQTPVPTAPPLTDVSCNADADTLKNAAIRRRQQAERRKLLLAEYPRWVAWTQSASQACYAGQNAEQQRQQQEEANAAKLAAAAEAATAAEQARQAAAKQQAEKEAEARAAALKQQQEQQDAARRAQEEQAAATKKAQEDALAQQKEQAEQEAKARESAEEKAQREKEEAEAKAKKEAAAAEDARIVSEREAKKKAAEQHQEDLIQAERKREGEARFNLEQQHKQAEAEHEKRLEELKKNMALSEQERDAAIAQANQDYAAAEDKRRADAQKEIEAAGLYDRSDERNTGAIGAHAAGGYFALTEANTNAQATGPVVGAQVTLHQGFWGTAPAHGMAAGLELRGTATFLQSVGSNGSAQLIHLVPEIRYWFGRLGVGLVFEWQQLAAEVASAANTVQVMGLGGSVSLAGLDDPKSRLLFTAKWTPLLNGHLERLTGEVEAGYQWFSLTLSGGSLTDDTSANKRSGWYVGGGIGGRFWW
jgi:hypothetical protein